jgi:integrase
MTSHEPTSPVSVADVMDNDLLRATAEKVGVCVRPLLRRVVDTETGEDRVIAMPCGSTRERACKPCADKARRVRMHQCREGWHRTEEFPPDPADDASDATDAAGDETGDDQDQGAARKRRTTRRREDAPPLPAIDMDKHRTVAAALTSPNGNTYRPSMFLTVTLPSYGPVNADGTPKHPNTYDYRRAALDAMHFASAVDRLFQNLRRCAGFNAQYFATVEPQQRLALHLHAAVRGVVTRQVFQQVVAATYHQVWWPKHDEPVYTLTNLPVWSEAQGGYVDPATWTSLRTWAEAMADLDHDDADPAHVVWFGKQTDHQWFIAGTRRSDKRIGYLTKYITKSIADAIDPDTATARQREHADRLHRETRWLPCSTKCANWLRYLRWADVDWQTPAIRIRGTAGMVAGKRTEGTTKSDQERIVPLDPQTMKVLRRHRRRQMAERLTAGEAWEDHGYVFRTGLGRPVPPETVTNLMAVLIGRYNEPAIPGTRRTKRQELPRPANPLPPARLHDLRHVHATTLLLAGVPVHVVAERLGHSDPAISCGYTRTSSDVMPRVLPPSSHRPLMGRSTWTTWTTRTTRTTRTTSGPRVGGEVLANPLASRTPVDDEPQASSALTWGFVVLPRLVSIQIFEIQSLAGYRLPHGGPSDAVRRTPGDRPMKSATSCGSNTPKGWNLRVRRLRLRR